MVMLKLKIVLWEKNYVREIKEKYPKVSDYLLSLGVDVEKTMETIPLELDEKGNISYWVEVDTINSLN